MRGALSEFWLECCHTRLVEPSTTEPVARDVLFCSGLFYFGPCVSIWGWIGRKVWHQSCSLGYPKIFHPIGLVDRQPFWWEDAQLCVKGFAKRAFLAIPTLNSKWRVKSIGIYSWHRYKVKTTSRAPWFNYPVWSLQLREGGRSEPSLVPKL